jgi:hypothetical protein
VPSRADMRRRLCALAAVVIAAMTLSAAALQNESVRATGGPPGDEEIQRALTIVKADPNLAAERTMKFLRWNESSQASTASLPAWLVGLINWFNESTRLLWWLAGATLAGVLVVYIIRTIRAHGPASIGAGTFEAPTHVQDLDIRPETLPEDIGAAARAMWDRGERRDALALLYRGMLSRFAHVHRVPIRDSSTEGDCLALSAGRLPAGGYDYASRLVTVWQRAVYGGETVATAAVHVLCVEFGPALNRAAQRDAPASGAPA